jgi:S-(hydroxymethyl)glutathione dehydrogenase/alcohol dehydrogenase
MITTTLAAVLEKPGTPLVLKELTLPALQPGQVLVKVFFSGVCRSQLMEARGGRGADPWLPHLLGHEGSGQVLAIGPGVTKIQPGDEVILSWLKGEGLDAQGAKYLCEGRVINSGKVTTFSKHTIVSESRVVRKPAGLPLDIAVLYGCALPTGAGMVFNELQPVAGSVIAVLGLGGIGLSALMALRAFDCKQIIAIDISDEKLALAQEFGATHIFNASRKDVVSAVKKLTDGGLDYCIESAGTVRSIELGFALIRKGGGKLLFASHPPDGETIKIAPHELISGKSIAGSWGGNSRPDRDVLRMSQVFHDLGVPLNRLLTKRYPLEKINEALNDLESNKAFRPLIVMGDA